jgi:hypothetical protein
VGCDETPATTVKPRARRPLHHASHGPPPPLSRGRINDTVLAARFLIRAKVMSQRFQTAITAIPIFVRSLRAVEGRINHDRGTARVAWIGRSEIRKTILRISSPLPSFTALYPAPNLLGSPPAIKEAERRETLFLNRRTFQYGARLAIRARLSAFHCGSRQTVVTFWLSSRPCFLGRGGSARSYGPPTGAKILRCYTGVTRARLSQSRVSTPAPVIMPEG